MCPRTNPPKVPPKIVKEEAAPTEGGMKVRPGKRPGAEVYEISYDSEPAVTKSEPPLLEKDDILEAAQPTSRRQTLPVPAPDQPLAHSPIPSEKVPTRPTGAVARRQAALQPETVRPPSPGGRRNDLGLGVPGPSFGGDTDFDAEPTDASRRSDSLRITSSFEKEDPDRVKVSRSVPVGDPLDLGLDEGPAGPSFDEPPNEALDMVGRLESSSIAPAEPSRRADPLAELRERYALGDFSGALTVAESIIEDDPKNADAQRYAESCRDVLKQMYQARLGPLDQVPTVAVPVEQLRWLTLDHRSGFLLSHVDGVSTLEEILDISGMPHLEAMRIIYDLLQQKVIVLQ